jgi:glutamine synthetase
MTESETLAERVGLNTPQRHEAIAAILASIKRNGIRYIRLAHPDLMGVLRGRMIAADMLPPLFESGHSFGCRLLLTDLGGDVHPSVQLGDIYDFGNFYLLPDPATFVQLPWSPETAILLADPYLPDGRPAVSSRLALKTAAEAALAGGLELHMGMELEGTLFTDDEQVMATKKQHLFTAVGQGLAAGWLHPVWDALDRMGIKLAAFSNEFSAGQIEFNLAPQPALQAADGLVLMKLAVRELMQSTGYQITFMARVNNAPDTLPNGLHVHQACVGQAGRNCFYDAAAPDGLSKTLLNFIGGQLAYARLIGVLSTPTVTGYRRYRPETWAPTSVTWSLDNRTTMLRVMADRGAATRVENRLPDSAANPYLALAIMIFAGLAGIEQNLDPGQPTTGYASTLQQQLPGNIWEAIRCLDESSDVVEFFGHDLANAYRGLLLQAADNLEKHVTDWEIAKYRDIL